MYEIPEGGKNTVGRAIQNLLNIPKEDKVRAYIILEKKLEDKNFINSHYILFCTKRGIVKKTLLESYSRPRQDGIIALEINEDDALIEAKLTNGTHEVWIAVRSGRAIRFREQEVRPMGRAAVGVRGIQIDDDANDCVVGMVTVDPNDSACTILVVSEKGLAKRSPLSDYPLHGRGGKGVKTLQVTDRTGQLVAIKAVRDEDDLVISTAAGMTIRTHAKDIPILGRATQGVKLIRLDEGDNIADVAVVKPEEEENGQTS